MTYDVLNHKLKESQRAGQVGVDVTFSLNFDTNGTVKTDTRDREKMKTGGRRYTHFGQKREKIQTVESKRRDRRDRQQGQ